MGRILVVEDEPAILRGLADNLRREQHEVFTAEDGEEGYRLVNEKRPDLVILDLMLPKLSGYEVCRKMRAEGMTMPILILTARGDETDRVLGLDLGADDYIVKPFSVRELLARVRAHLRRAQPVKSAPDQIAVGEVTVDFRSYEARRAGQPLEMTRREFQALRLLVSRPGEVVCDAGRDAGTGVGLARLSDHADGGQPYRRAARQAGGRSGPPQAPADRARRGL